MTKVFLRFDNNNDSVSWVALDEAGQTTASGHGPLNEAAESLRGQRVVVLVPGEKVVMYHAAVPAQKRRLLKQAVPYALEEQLAEDVESLHFAIGQVSDDMVMVAVVSHECMTEWLDRLSQAGIEALSMVPDYLSLPLEENSWQLLRLGDTCLLRCGDQVGSAMDAANAEVYLDILVNEAADAKPAVLKLNELGETPLSLNDASVTIERAPSSELPLQFMAKGFDAQKAVNLLQGQYSRRERIGQFWRPWRYATAMLGSFFALQLTLSVIDYQDLRTEQQQLRADVEQIYRQAFPDAKKVVNPKVQMERALKALRGGASSSGGFSDLLGQAGQQLKAMSGAELQRISYKSGVLDVSLMIADLQQLDQLKQKLTQGGLLEVEIQSASARADQIEARLRIKGQS